ncbi:hypothetical protein GCM10007962_30550 [Yeosuana aromativorans]|uniref:exo-alpha-sialidase n=1 Tax=Yeosuana aromativorans TaxID=288019 RepID=A0A8J3BT86_9FLAO|nr:exo-alpha-sialidase [Yeosuana aromativorans]GGK33989.1 hypothetical protein GCM10007962_30550 [Yeosuana aromativorans]
MKKKIFVLSIILILLFVSLVSCKIQKKDTFRQSSSLSSGIDQVLFQPGDDGVREFRIPSLITTNKGTLLGVCDARVNRGGDLPNHINMAIRRSTDNGKTWSTIDYVMKSKPNEGVCDPTLVVDKETGTIWAFGLHGDKGVGLFNSRAGIDNPETAQIYAFKSDDDGLTWSEPKNMNFQIKNPKWLCALGAPGRGIQMTNGTIVVPAYYRSYGDEKLLNSYLFYSKDHGKTWEYSNTPAENTTECTIVETADGRLMLNMRNHYNKGCRATSYTSDMGKTWTPLKFDQALIDPVCQASLLEYQIGDKRLLLFSNPASTNYRKNQSIKISYDEGKTWPVSKVIFKGKSGYSCLTQLQNGRIGLLYEKENRGAIYYRNMSLDWLESKEEQKNIVVFGNSTTAWRPLAVKKVYGLRLEEKLQQAGFQCNVINSGVGGSHTGTIEDNNYHKVRHARDRFQSDVLDYSPEIVVMQYGINDSYVDKGGEEGESRIPLDKYYENLTFMVKEMQKAGIKVVLMTPNQFDERKEAWRLERLSLYKNELKRVAIENNLPLVDVWELNEQYKKENGSLSALLLDGVHPNDKLHEVIAEKLFTLIKGML